MVVEPERLRSNEFWGKRSGSVHSSKGRIFPGRRGNVTAHQEHQGPTSKRDLRWNYQRALRRKLGKHGVTRLNKGKK